MPEFIYIKADGTKGTINYPQHVDGTALEYPPGMSWTAKRELFCRLMALDCEPAAAYGEAYNVPLTSTFNKSRAQTEATRLMGNSDVLLRIQQLRTPSIRKFQKKLEYTLQKALEQCEIVWTLSYTKGDTKTMLKAVEMQAKLGKLLSEQIDVTHRHGFLDDTDTKVLVEMKKQLEDRAKRAVVTATIVTEETHP